MDIHRVAVAGLGQLGRGIAACLVAHRFHVVAFSRRQETRGQAERYIAEAIDDLIRRAGFPEALAEAWPERYEAVDKWEALGGCQFVIESVAEDPAVKAEVFDAIESVVDAGVPVASNTSSLPITLLQRDRRHPERFVGMHWAEPAHATRFLELIRGQETSEDAFQAAAGLARRMGKEPALVQKDVPGFVVNRLGYALYREALHLVQTGVADMETIDLACRNALGLWATLCGPFRWIDLTGGPALYGRTQQRVWPTLSNETQIPRMLEEMIEADARGTANGRGFYHYTEEEAKRWAALHREHAWTVRELLDKYFPLDAT